jgi:hypothetical protein
MIPSTFKVCLSTILCMASALAPIRLRAEPAERFWWNGQINGKPVRLVLDTGCSDFLLWRSAADRLGLKLTSVKLDSNTWVTGECELVLPHWQRRWGFPVTAHGQERALVCEPPAGLGDMDGLLGWPPFSRRITRFDAAAGKFEFLDKVPKEVKAWSKFTLRTNVDALMVELSGADGTFGGLTRAFAMAIFSLKSTDTMSRSGWTTPAKAGRLTATCPDSNRHILPRTARRARWSN